MTRREGYWIGHPGALLPLPDATGTLARKTERATTFVSSASGRRRAYRSARRAPLREWTISLARLRPEEASALHGLVMDTNPPYVWVDAWSRVTNLLAPSAAGLESVLPVDLPAVGRQPLAGGGYAPTGLANPDGVTVHVEPAPAQPGMPLTASAFLTSAAGGGRVVAEVLDSDGAIITTAAGTTVTATTELTRSWVTVLNPPAGTAAVSIRIEGADVLAQPAVTWTPDLLPYGPGGGAAQVVVSGFDEAVQFAMLEPAGLRLADLQFTVTEVG